MDEVVADTLQQESQGGSSEPPCAGAGSLAVRAAELEQLCREVLAATVDVPLPAALVQRLWRAVGHARPPHAFTFDLPPVPPSEPDAACGPVPVSAGQPPAGAVSPVDPRPGPPPAELKPLPDTLNVLVVDDDPMMLTVLVRILERENFRLVTAESGAAALHAIEASPAPIHLLVTDFAMPGMQGRELADRVRRRHPDLRVLYQTGFSDLLFDTCVELEDGAAFLEKPFTARGLREAARLVLFGTLNPS